MKIEEERVGEKSGESIQNGSKKGLRNWHRTRPVEGDEVAFE